MSEYRKSSRTGSPPAFLSLLLLLLLLPSVHTGGDAIPSLQGNSREVRVPETDGRPVMIDGLFTDGEWDDALAITVSDTVTFLLKQEKGQVFIGVRCPGLIARARGASRADAPRFPVFGKNGQGCSEGGVTITGIPPNWTIAGHFSLFLIRSLYIPLISNTAVVSPALAP